MSGKAARVTAPKQAGAYHHGDLRRHLIDAAAQALTGQEAAALSLVQLARDAKVSAGAPYHHFRDKSELIALVAQRGFELLLAELTAVHVAKLTPEAELAALVRAYCRFGRDRWPFYKVMFDPDVTRPENRPHVEPLGRACLQALADSLRRVIPPAAAPQAMGRAIGCWSLVHGLIQLTATGPVPMTVEGDGLAALAIDGVRAIAMR